mgnify:FL=1
MKFLGLRLDEHDSNICYTDGTKVRYYKPERHNQLKHFGYNNLYDWLYSTSLFDFNIKDLDAIAIVIDVFRHPYIKKEDPNKLYETIDIPLKPFTDIKCPVYRLDHHYAHALSSWMLTNTKTHAVLDGWGDMWQSVSFFKNHKKIKSYTLEEVKSFGIFLGNMSSLFGIQNDNREDGAGKLMALQSYGQVHKKLWNKIKNIKYENNNKVFDFNMLDRVNDSQFVNKLCLLDFLRTTHKYAEEKIPDFFKKHIGSKPDITYSGGVAHNICVNTELKKTYKNMVIPPHCADEGLSLGCVEFLRRLYEQKKFAAGKFPFWQTDIAPNKKPSNKTIKFVAEQLAQGKIVGWYQGNGEIGPRALGNRSILMSPEVNNGKHIINDKVKHRESFRPFAASVLSHRAKEFFDCDGESEFMKYAVKFKDKIFDPISHVDNTSRIQTVPAKPCYKDFWCLIHEFSKLTGLPMLLNTSLNDNGKPIAGSPGDALDLFKNSQLDILVVGDEIVKK